MSLYPFCPHPLSAPAASTARNSGGPRHDPFHFVTPSRRNLSPGSPLADGRGFARGLAQGLPLTQPQLMTAPLAQLQDPGAHAILAADANFKMHSEATEELEESPSTDETIGVSLISPTSVLGHGSLARQGSFSKRSTSDSFRAKRGARGALCRASHAVLGADDDFKM